MQSDKRARAPNGSRNATIISVWDVAITPEFKKRFALAAASAGKHRGTFAAEALAEAMDRVLGKPLHVAPRPVKAPSKFSDPEFVRAYDRERKRKKAAEKRAAQEQATAAAEAPIESKRERHLRLMREAQRRKVAARLAAKRAAWAEYGWQGEGVGA